MVLGLHFGPLGVLVEALLPQEDEHPGHSQTGPSKGVREAVAGGEVGCSVSTEGGPGPAPRCSQSTLRTVLRGFSYTLSGRRNTDELGIIATIGDRFRTVLEESDPNWQRLPYHRKRALSVERQLMRELRLSHTIFSNYASEARRSLFGTGNEQA